MTEPQAPVRSEIERRQLGGTATSPAMPSRREARSLISDGAASRLLRQFIALNRRFCRVIDRCLPSRFSVDGNRRFADDVVPRYTHPGAFVVDVGGGQTPFFSVDAKRALQLCVVGIDAAGSELARAPAGAYTAVVVGDVCASPLSTSADLVICMTVIEHVQSATKAIEEMSRLLRPGGVIALLVPGRNAAFAQLNRILPEGFKRRLLTTLYPDTHDRIGFAAYYDRCTPSELERAAHQAGIRVMEKEVYNWSGYFDFFVPLYACWRIYSLVAVLLFGEDATDRFSLVLARDE